MISDLPKYIALGSILRNKNLRESDLGKSKLFSQKYIPIVHRMILYSIPNISLKGLFNLQYVAGFLKEEADATDLFVKLLLTA